MHTFAVASIERSMLVYKTDRLRSYDGRIEWKQRLVVSLGTCGIASEAVGNEGGRGEGMQAEGGGG